MKTEKGEELRRKLCPVDGRACPVESLSSGRETVGSLSGSRLSLRPQLFLSTMSGEYLNNKGAVDVLLVAFAAL